MKVDIKALIGKRKAALEAAKAIQTAGEASEDGLSDEQITEIEGHVSTANDLRTQIEAAEVAEAKRLATVKALGDAAAWDRQPQQRISAPVNPSVATNPSNPTIVGGEASTSFDHFGEYMFQIRQAAMVPAAQDPRLFAAAPGMRTDVDSLGGFLIPDQFATGIIEKMYNVGELLRLIKQDGMYIPLERNTIKLPRVDESSRATGSRTGGIRGYWVGETDSITDSKPKVGELTLTLHKAAALAYITEEMLEDESASGMILMKWLTEELIFTVENAIVNGNGANKPVGLIAANCAVQATKVTNQTADTVWGDNITAMWARMFAPLRQTAVWLYNQSIEPFLFSATLAGRFGSESTAVDGIPLFFPAGSLLNQGKYSLLMGRPAIPVEYTKAVGDVGDLILWDPSSYVLADKGGVKTASSIHVQFLTDQTAFRVTYRIDGQPTWDTPLTPFDAGDTLSPIVLLESR